MPFIGLGLHLAVALFFAIHAVRRRQELYWLLILFSFPLLGSIVYFFAVFLPHSRIEQRALQAGRAFGRMLDPGQAVREAQRAFDLTPTAHNQMRLASTLLAAGQSGQAVEHYEACLRGPFAGDGEVLLGTARAKLAHGKPETAVGLLLRLQAAQPQFRPEEVGLALGRAYAAHGYQEEAGHQFEMAAGRFGSIEARVELALWALANGRKELAQRELQEIGHARRHMTKNARGLHQDLFKRLDAAAG